MRRLEDTATARLHTNYILSVLILHAKFTLHESRSNIIILINLSTGISIWYNNERVNKQFRC